MRQKRPLTQRSFQQAFGKLSDGNIVENISARANEWVLEEIRVFTLQDSTIA